MDKPVHVNAKEIFDPGILELGTTNKEHDAQVFEPTGLQKILYEMAQIYEQAHKDGWSDEVIMQTVKMWLSRYWVS